MKYKQGTVFQISGGWINEDGNQPPWHVVRARSSGLWTMHQARNFAQYLNNEYDGLVTRQKVSW